MRAAIRLPCATVITALIMVPGSRVGGTAASAQEIEIDTTGVRIVSFDPLSSDAMCSLGEEPTFHVGDDQSSEALWFSRVLGLARLSDGSVAVADDASSEVHGSPEAQIPAGNHMKSYRTA